MHNIQNRNNKRKLALNEIINNYQHRTKKNKKETVNQFLVDAFQINLRKRESMNQKQNCKNQKKKKTSTKRKNYEQILALNKITEQKKC